MIIFVWEWCTPFIQLKYNFYKAFLSDFFLDLLLTANDLVHQEIMLVTLRPEKIQDITMTRKDHGISTWNYPLTLTNQQFKTHGYSQKNYVELFNIASQLNFVQKNYQTYTRFLRILIETKYFIAEDPDKARHNIYAAERNKKLNHDICDAFNNQLVSDQSLLIMLEQETKLTQKNKMDNRAVMTNYLSFNHLGSF